MISPHLFTLPLYVPRIYRQWRNWPQYLFNYLLRRQTGSEYRMRNGVRLVEGRGTLEGTIAVVFVRQEYGTVEAFRTIVDIGANVGIFAVYAAQSSPEAKIFCFEPEPVNFDSLKRNVALNDLGGRVLTFRFAVAGNGGPRELAVAESLSNSFHMIADGASVQTVDCTTLTEILSNEELRRVDLLKMNCEGAEYEILEGCSQGDFDRIANIRLEYHNLEAPGRNGESLKRLLSKRGYTIQRFTRYLNTSGFIWAARSLSGPKLLLGLFPQLLSSL